MRVSARGDVLNRVCRFVRWLGWDGSTAYPIVGLRRVRFCSEPLLRCSLVGEGRYRLSQSVCTVRGLVPSTYMPFF